MKFLLHYFPLHFSKESQSQDTILKKRKVKNIYWYWFRDRDIYTDPYSTTSEVQLKLNGAFWKSLLRIINSVVISNTRKFSFFSSERDDFSTSSVTSTIKDCSRRYLPLRTLAHIRIHQLHALSATSISFPIF